ncbi:unnamed protein product [Nyctereutes procyonoides]|uniref:(raccoon dog) hypothetical protein n=1 Tax=Nyctereutes procyonoides TaxID=34880 RepID=A0A811YAW4_NYCPR|nr:unnamed protein product [Nyctereutes procyonoides]
MLPCLSSAWKQAWVSAAVDARPSCSGPSSGSRAGGSQATEGHTWPYLGEGGRAAGDCSPCPEPLTPCPPWEATAVIRPL